MTRHDQLWLGGMIAVCLGIADDNLLLKLMGAAMFLLVIWERRRDDPDEESTGRCGVGAPMTDFTSLPRPVCALPAEHAGWHRADGGCEWGQIREEAP